MIHGQVLADLYRCSGGNFRKFFSDCFYLSVSMGKARDVRREVNLPSHSHLESQDLEILSNYGSDEQSVIGKHFV